MGAFLIGSSGLSQKDETLERIKIAMRRYMYTYAQRVQKAGGRRISYKEIDSNVSGYNL